MNKLKGLSSKKKILIGLISIAVLIGVVFVPIVIGDMVSSHNSKVNSAKYEEEEKLREEVLNSVKYKYTLPDINSELTKTTKGTLEGTFKRNDKFDYYIVLDGIRNELIEKCIEDGEIVSLGKVVKKISTGSKFSINFSILKSFDKDEFFPFKFCVVDKGMDLEKAIIESGGSYDDEKKSNLEYKPDDQDKIKQDIELATAKQNTSDYKLNAFDDGTIPNDLANYGFLFSLKGIPKWVDTTDENTTYDLSKIVEGSTEEVPAKTRQLAVYFTDNLSDREVRITQVSHFYDVDWPDDLPNGTKYFISRYQSAGAKNDESIKQELLEMGNEYNFNITSDDVTQRKEDIFTGYIEKNSKGVLVFTPLKID